VTFLETAFSGHQAGINSKQLWRNRGQRNFQMRSFTFRMPQLSWHSFISDTSLQLLC